jgi:Bacterial Ig-like domain (group 1).
VKHNRFLNGFPLFVSMVKSNILEITAVQFSGTPQPPPSSGEVILKSLVVNPQTVQIGQPVTITATYVYSSGQPISGLTVQIVVQSTSSYEVVGQSYTLQTDSNGQVTVTYTDTIVAGTWSVTVSHEIFSNEFKIDGTASFTVEGAPGIFLYAGSVSLGYYTGVANYWAAVVNALFRCSSCPSNTTGVATVSDSLGSSQTVYVTPANDVIYVGFKHPSLPSGYTVTVTIEALGLTKTYTFVFDKIANLASISINPLQTYYVYG